MIFKTLKLSFLLVFLSLSVVIGQDIKEKLNEIPEIISVKDTLVYGVPNLEIFYKQKLNHNSDSKYFSQRILLKHVSFEKPVVLVTEGYSLGHNYIEELSEIIDANQVRVEHRFFGQSIPDSMEWQYLDIYQAAKDYHSIVNSLKNIYSGNWLSTGWSKGGQTTMIYRWQFPEDVKAGIIYDSPLNFELEEKRIDDFFDHVGNEFCRQKLIEFQRLVLLNKDEILPLFNEVIGKWNYTYSIGEIKALEYIVLEYPFSFWQYHKFDCNDIPDNHASMEQIFNHLDYVVSFWSYSDAAMNSASMYQFSTQLGYYGYVTENVEDLLMHDQYPNSAYAPQIDLLKYDPKHMYEQKAWLEEHGNNFIYIYGEYDPWSAPAVDVSDKTNSKVFYIPAGNHFSFINSFNDETRNEIITQVIEWIK